MALPPRPSVPLTLPDAEEHRRQLAIRANASLPKDGTEGMQMPLRLQELVVADLSTDPYDPSLWEGSIVYVSDGSAGQKIRYSDGSSWIVLG